MVMTRSQYFAMMRIVSQMGADKKRVTEALLGPKSRVMQVNPDHAANKDEYMELYKQKLLFDLQLSDEAEQRTDRAEEKTVAYTSDNKARLQLLEVGGFPQLSSIQFKLKDVISVYYLGKWRAATRHAVMRVHEEFKKRVEKVVNQISEQKKKEQSWGSWLMRKKVEVTEEDINNYSKENTSVIGSFMDSDLQKKVVDNLNAEAKTMEDIDVPKKVVVGFGCSNFSVLLEDHSLAKAGLSSEKLQSIPEHRNMTQKDKVEVLYANLEVSTELKRIFCQKYKANFLQGMVFLFGMASKVDCRGNDGQEWLLIMGLFYYFTPRQQQKSR